MQKAIGIVYEVIVYALMNKNKVTGEFDISYYRENFRGIGPHTVLFGPANGDMYNYYQIEKYGSTSFETIIDSVYIPGFTNYRDTIYY